MLTLDLSQILTLTLLIDTTVINLHFYIFTLHTGNCQHSRLLN